jgi:hypothetical protein
MTQKGNIVYSAGDPSSVGEDLTPTIETDSVAALKRVRIVAVKVWKITESKHFFLLHAETEIKDKSKLVTH